LMTIKWKKKTSCLSWKKSNPRKKVQEARWRKWIEKSSILRKIVI